MIRITGMNSGLDTEAMISELSKAHSSKVTTLQKKQTRLEWKQEAWKNLNGKIYSLFSNTLSKLKFSDAYRKKTTTCSDSTKATVVASAGAVNGSQSLTVDSLATAGYLTGARIGDKGRYKADSKVSELDASLVGKTISVNGEDVTITEDTTMSSLAKELSDKGINASFDATNQRFFLSAKATGADNDFVLGGDADALAALGFDYESNLDADGEIIDKTGAVRIKGTNATITLNGAEFTSDTNTFAINGLTVTVKGTTVPGETLSINTETDYDGIYDTIKGFIKEYSDLMNEMTKLYNAASNKSMDPLTDEEKDAMTDTQIEQWEEKIKSGILSGDSTIATVRNELSKIMMQPIEIGGEKIYLADYGIATGDYFSTEVDARYAYHIDGDPDDQLTGSAEDKLKSAIAADPDAVAQFFQKLSNNLYTKLNDLMASTEYSSIYKVYDDKQMKSDLSDFEKKIQEAQQKLADLEDKWYAKFAKMEAAMASMQNGQNSISALFGQ